MRSPRDSVLGNALEHRFYFLLMGLSALSACAVVLIEGDDPGECSDGADNDADALYDCDDPDCLSSPACAAGDDDLFDDDDSSGPLTYEDIQPVLIEHCGPCHVGETLRACDGFSCFASFYEASQLYTCCPGYVDRQPPEQPPSDCPVTPGRPEGWLTVAECSLLILGERADFGQPELPADDLALLQSWVDEGMVAQP